MSINIKIEENLKNRILTMSKALNDFSFEQNIKREIDEIRDINWINETDQSIEEITDDYKNTLGQLLKETELHHKLKSILTELIDPNNLEIQNKIQQELLKGIDFLKQPEKKHLDHKINMLFFEHDFDNKASLCGFEDLAYQFKILNGKEYLKFNYEYQFFNRNGIIDYNPILKPFNDLESELGEEKIELLYESSEIEIFYGGLKNLFILNAYLAMHYSFRHTHNELSKEKSLFHEKVFVFANEHDCEQLNIFVV